VHPPGIGVKSDSVCVRALSFPGMSLSHIAHIAVQKKTQGIQEQQSEKGRVPAASLY